MGITPELVVGSWTGGDDKWIRFLTLDDGQGYVMARPVVQNFLKKLEKDTANIFNYDAKFATPPAGYEDLINCEKYKQVEVEVERDSLLNQKLIKDRFDEEFDDEFN